MHSSARKPFFLPPLLLICVLGIGYAPLAKANRIPDPMRPPLFTAVPKRSASVPFRLTSVLIAPDRRVATINGRRLEVGDQVDGATVLRIEPSRVILRLGTGGILALTLYPVLRRSFLRSPR